METDDVALDMLYLSTEGQRKEPWPVPMGYVIMTFRQRMYVL